MCVYTLKQKKNDDTQYCCWYWCQLITKLHLFIEITRKTFTIFYVQCPSKEHLRMTKLIHIHYSLTNIQINIFFKHRPHTDKTKILLSMYSTTVRGICVNTEMENWGKTTIWKSKWRTENILKFNCFIIIMETVAGRLLSN